MARSSRKNRSQTLENKIETFKQLKNKKSKEKDFEHLKKILTKAIGSENISKILRDEEIDLSPYSDVSFNSYAILNINSLSKRLGVAKEIIKNHEERGDVNLFIQTRLKAIEEDQQKLSKLLLSIKESINESKPYTFSSPEDKTFFKQFIEKNISGINPKQIDQFLGEWLKKEEGKYTEAQQFIETLSSKIWWDSDIFKTSHEKIALTKKALGKISTETTFYHGKALKRSGHQGKLMNRLQFLPWDKANRYALAVGDYIYSKAPIDYPKNMVPLQIPYVKEERFILLNVHSLARIGLDEKTTRRDAASGRLYESIQEKISVLNAFNDYFNQDFSFREDENWEAIIEDYRVQHPDKEIRSTFEKTAKAIKKDPTQSKAHLNELKTHIQSLKGFIPKDKILIDSKTSSHFGTPLILKGSEAEFPYGVGGIPVKDFKAHIGTAAEIPRHAGKKMQRINFFSWAPFKVFSVACSERLYSHKPAYHTKNMAPVKVFNTEGNFKGWLLMNVHSLGRLGLTPHQIANAVLEDELHSKIALKLKVIDDFKEKALKIDLVDKENFTTYLEDLSAMSINHPNPGVQLTLHKAINAWGALNEEEKKTSLSDFKEALSIWLERTGAIPTSGFGSIFAELNGFKKPRYVLRF